jgi:hypothetical protein
MCFMCQNRGQNSSSLKTKLETHGCSEYVKKTYENTERERENWGQRTQTALTICTKAHIKQKKRHHRVENANTVAVYMSWQCMYSFKKNRITKMHKLECQACTGRKHWGRRGV